MIKNKKIEDLLNKELYGWKMGYFKPCIEEKIEDIVGVVRYSSYGDDYLIIITNNGCFQYGCYINLKTYNIKGYHDFIRATDKDKKIAGKKIYYGEKLEQVDEIEFTITKNGTIRTWEDGNVRCKLSKYDEWGVNLYDISLKQFGYKPWYLVEIPEFNYKELV